MATQYIGIDIGSTCAKTAVLSETGELVLSFVLPTGWSSVDTAEDLRRRLCEAGYDPEKDACVSTGYGREGGDGDYLSRQGRHAPPPQPGPDGH